MLASPKPLLPAPVSCGGEDEDEDDVDEDEDDVEREVAAVACCLRSPSTSCGPPCGLCCLCESGAWCLLCDFPSMHTDAKRPLTTTSASSPDDLLLCDIGSKAPKEKRRLCGACVSERVCGACACVCVCE